MTDYSVFFVIAITVVDWLTYINTHRLADILELKRKEITCSVDCIC